MKLRWRKMWPIAAVAVVIAIAGTLLVLNLMPPEKTVDQRVERLYDSQSPQFHRSMGVLLGPAIVPGNKVETLVNGKEIFPAMLEAIARAKQTITFETYIYWEGAVGDAFAKALAERARAGVRVHVLLDAVGAVKMKESMLDDMRARRRRDRALPSVAVVPPRAHEQPDAPEDAGRRRPHRIHGRRRHRRQVGRPGRGSRALARHALPRRRSRRRADAGDLSRQLDPGPRRSAARRAVLPGAGEGGSTSARRCS